MATTQLLRFEKGFGGFGPATIFARKGGAGTELRAISSGEAFKGAGFEFGQESLIKDISPFSAFTIGRDITTAEELRGLSAPIAPTPIRIEPEQQIPAEVLTQAPVTVTDLRTRLLTGQAEQTAQTKLFLAEMKQLQKLTLKAVEPTEEELGVQKDIAEITQQSRELRASFRAGVDKITGQPIPMGLAMGQARELEQQANRRLEALSLAQAPLVDTLQALQASREVKLTQLNIMRQFAVQNQAVLSQNAKEAQELTFQLFRLQQEETQLRRQEAEQAKQFAIENNITSTFYQVAGVIYNSNTGEPTYQIDERGEISTSDGETVFATPKEFFEHSGLTSFDEIQRVEAPEEELSVSEAKALGLPFGTTVTEAKRLGIVPRGVGTGITKLQPTEGFSSAKTESEVRELVNIIKNSDWEDRLNPTEDELIRAFDEVRLSFSGGVVTDQAIVDLLGVTPDQFLSSTEEAADALLSDEGGIFGGIIDFFQGASRAGEKTEEIPKKELTPQAKELGGIFGRIGRFFQERKF